MAASPHTLHSFLNFGLLGFTECELSVVHKRPVASMTCRNPWIILPLLLKTSSFLCHVLARLAPCPRIMVDAFLNHSAAEPGAGSTVLCSSEADARLCLVGP